MSADLPLLTVASAMANHATTRHAVIARNVAHVDTPGYKARDLMPFDAYAALRRAGETGFAGAGPLPRPREIESLSAAPDGNTVSVEDQLMRAAEATLQHKTALGIYRKSLDLLRLGLGR